MQVYVGLKRLASKINNPPGVVMLSFFDKHHNGLFGLLYFFYDGRG